MRCLLRLGDRHGLGFHYDERRLERYVDYAGDVCGYGHDGDAGGGYYDEAGGDDDQGGGGDHDGGDDDEAGDDVECGGGEGGGDGGCGGRGFGGCCCSLRGRLMGREKYLLSGCEVEIPVF